MKEAYKRVEFLVAYIILALSAVSFIRFALIESLQTIKESIESSGVM